MSERLSNIEMAEKYPNQWLGIRNIECDAEGNVLTAEIVYIDKTASELAMMTIRGENVQPFFTTPDNIFI